MAPVQLTTSEVLEQRFVNIWFVQLASQQLFNSLELQTRNPSGRIVPAHYQRGRGGGEVRDKKGGGE